MPTYHIHHLTQYSYEESVSVCHNQAHLLPRTTPHHFWHSAEIEISPTPAIRIERTDYFGNRLTFFAIQEPHRQLRVISRGIVDIDPPSDSPESSPPSPLSSLPWEQVRDQIAAAHHPDLLDAAEFSFESPYIRTTDEVADYAHPSFIPGRPITEVLLDLTARINKDFKYDPKSTTVSTTLPEILRARAGVCQDFAHLQIGCLRSMGLAARYISGYLLTAPPPGQPRLTGADASHAWLSVYVPDLGEHSEDGQGGDGSSGGGWLDLDPTNNLIPSEKHITLAWGRDFGDVSPLRGVILGGGRHQIQVQVDVTPLPQ